MAQRHDKKPRLHMRVESRALRIARRVRDIRRKRHTAVHAEPRSELSRAIHRFLRFAGSSLVCTALDQVLAGLLFIALRRPLHGHSFLRILLATLIARVFSQALNYALNHHLVFVGGDEQAPRRPSRRESLPRFLAVATLVLSLSIIGVYLLHARLGIAESIGKLIVDSLLFFLNYFLQRNWVFTNEPVINPRRARRRRDEARR